MKTNINKIFFEAIITRDWVQWYVALQIHNEIISYICQDLKSGTGNGFRTKSLFFNPETGGYFRFMESCATKAGAGYRQKQLAANARIFLN